MNEIRCVPVGARRETAKLKLSSSDILAVQDIFLSAISHASALASLIDLSISRG